MIIKKNSIFPSFSDIFCRFLNCELRGVGRFPLLRRRSRCDSLRCLSEKQKKVVGASDGSLETHFFGRSEAFPSKKRITFKTFHGELLHNC